LKGHNLLTIISIFRLREPRGVNPFEALTDSRLFRESDEKDKIPVIEVERLFEREQSRKRFGYVAD
jgi:hypothetical protein